MKVQFGIHYGSIDDNKVDDFIDLLKDILTPDNTETPEVKDEN